jgi:hypothetical protein
MRVPSKSKNLSACKPDFVCPVMASHSRTRLSFILPYHYWPGHAAYPPASGEQPSNAGIHGITAHKVYPPGLLPNRAVSSYLTFSPWPRKRGGNFLWHFLLPALPQAAGCSPVCCSLLSRLSSPPYGEAITRLIERRRYNNVEG